MPHGEHDHGHHHPEPPARFDAAYALGAGLNACFVAGEVIFGIAANSVALLADAAHNLTDVLGLLLAWGAAFLSRRGPSRRRTYGYGRSSILASLANAVVLLVSVGGIAVEALRRLAHPEPVAGLTVIAVAAAGIVVNGATALLFRRGRHGDLNVRGAFLHMAADAAVSAGVVVSGLLVLRTGWLRLDPLVSLGIAALLLVSTWGLLRAATDLALDAVPQDIDAGAVEAYLRRQSGVADVHDLHIWALSTTTSALTAHLVRPHAGPDDAFLARLCGEMKQHFGICHATFQLETGDPAHPCTLAPEDVI